MEKLDASDDDSGSESGSDAGSDSSSESYSGSDSESGSGSDSDAGGGAEGTRYRALAPGVIRTGAALDSPKAEPDKLTIGEEILVTNQQIVDGSTRLQFDRGWTSETAKSGKVLLERTDPEPDKEKQANRAGESLGFDAVETWRAVAPGVVRTGAALDSPKAELDTLKVGQVIKVTEQKVVNGTVRLHFARGWTSEKARSGKVLLERVEAQSLNSETTDGDLEHLEKELEAEEPDALDQLAAALESDDSQQESEPEPQLEPEPEPEQSPDEDWLVGDDSDEVSIFDDPAPEQDLQRAQPLTVEDFQPGLAVEIISDQWRGCSTGITLKKAGKKAHVQFDDGEKQWVPFAELQRKGDMSTAKPKSEPDTNDGCKPKDHALVDSAAQAETEKAQRAPDLQPTQRSEAVPGVGTRPSQDQSSVLVHSEAADTDEESDTEGGDIRTAAAEEDEKIKAEEQAAADAEQAAKDRKTKERAEKRRNMSKEDKMAKMKLRPVQKKAETMKQENRLADPARYEEALAFIEDEQWVKAEAALKDAMFDVKADETKKTDQNDTEQEEEEVAAATTAAVQAKQAAERAAAQQRAAAEVVAKDATEAEEPTRAQPQPAGEAQDQVVGIKAKLQAGEAAWANERAELQVEIVRLKAAEAQRDAHAADWTSERDSLRAEIAQLKKAAEIQRDATAQRAAAAVTEKVAMEESEKLLLLDIEALRNAHNEQMAEAAKQYESKLELLGSENSAKLIVRVYSLDVYEYRVCRSWVR